MDYSSAIVETVNLKSNQLGQHESELSNAPSNAGISQNWHSLLIFELSSVSSMIVSQVNVRTFIVRCFVCCCGCPHWLFVNVCSSWMFDRADVYWITACTLSCVQTNVWICGARSCYVRFGYFVAIWVTWWPSRSLRMMIGYARLLRDRCGQLNQPEPSEPHKQAKIVSVVMRALRPETRLVLWSSHTGPTNHLVRNRLETTKRCSAARFTHLLHNGRQSNYVLHSVSYSTCTSVTLCHVLSATWNTNWTIVTKIWWIHVHKQPRPSTRRGERVIVQSGRNTVTLVWFSVHAFRQLEQLLAKVGQATTSTCLYLYWSSVNYGS